MIKHILTIGLNDKDTKQQKYDIVTCYKMVETTLKKYVDGYTIYQAQGYYKHENGEFVSENSLRVELLFTRETIVKKIAKDIKIILNQESIVYEKQTTNSNLI